MRYIGSNGVVAIIFISRQLGSNYMAQVVLLGISQDGGTPQPGCVKSCCIGMSTEQTKYPVSLGIVGTDGTHLIDVSRHLTAQLQFMAGTIPSHIWLTHAHFGHVDGLGLFGREIINAQGIQLNTSAIMNQLLLDTPHWKLMLDQGIFETKIFTNKQVLQQQGFDMIPIMVPHRNELSDMHAFLIRGSNKNVLYLPDHDTWEETLAMHDSVTIRDWLNKLSVDIALIDGTFWSNKELKSRDQSQVPHPPIKQSIELLGYKQQGDPDIIFIHLNHTNPVYDEWSEEHTQVVEMGWKVGKQGMRFSI